MAAVDRWVIRQVLRWMADNRDRLERFGGFAVNVSGDSMNDETFPDFVLQQFELTGAPTGKVCFEITETAAITNLASASYVMRELTSRGCLVALDDFGSGLSSFNYLRTLPVHFLKIDGQFVQNVAHDAIDRSMVEAIAQVGRSMGIQTVAERVETVEVFETLKSLGVTNAQGFLISAAAEPGTLPAQAAGRRHGGAGGRGRLR